MLPFGQLLENQMIVFVNLVLRWLIDAVAPQSIQSLFEAKVLRAEPPLGTRGVTDE